MGVRKLIFRGKSVSTGGWLYGYLGEVNIKVLQSICKEKVIFENLAWFNTDNFGYVVNDCSVDESTIGQFTGLHDKNGKEIYEGDVVVVQSLDPFGLTVEDLLTKAVISFYRGGFVVSYNNGCQKVDICSLCEQCEVIGNIVDNPELINKED